MNQDGLQNLNRIVTESWKADNFYHWPSVSSEMLAKHSEGLIVLSGCSDSLIGCLLLGGKSLGDKRLTCSDEQFEEAVEAALWYQEIFGDRYYLEVQRFPGLERCRVMNPLIAQIASMTGIKMAATADVHYPFPEDNEMQKVLHAAHRGSTVEVTEANWEYDILLTYPTSDEEIINDLIKTGLGPRTAEQAVLETGRIAERCTVELPKNEPIRWPGTRRDLLPWG